MPTTNAQIQAPDTLSVLMEYDVSDLIQALAGRYNQEADDWDALVGDNLRLSQQLEGYKRQATLQLDDIQQLKQRIDELDQENAQCRALAKEAERIADHSIALQNSKRTLQVQVTALQKEIQQMKQAGDPKALRNTIAEKNKKLKELEKRNDALLRGNKDEAKRHEQTRVSLNQAIDKIAMLQRTLAHDTGAGLYHNDKHHLIIWPQQTKMQGEDGSVFEGRSLLYMHQSGRGGLMTYNPGTNEVNLCAAPAGGLRPDEDTREFAKNWLFKVNALQGGVVQDDDMIPVNYNGQEG
ncbi:hypothetical protein OMA37_004402 [Vibrio fluvialis]|nr:hypothetical protein [Vibrio fluvialis]